MRTARLVHRSRRNYSLTVIFVYFFVATYFRLCCMDADTSYCRKPSRFAYTHSFLDLLMFKTQSNHRFHLITSLLSLILERAKNGSLWFLKQVHLAAFSFSTDDSCEVVIFENCSKMLSPSSVVVCSNVFFSLKQDGTESGTESECGFCIIFSQNQADVPMWLPKGSIATTFQMDALIAFVSKWEYRIHTRYFLVLQHSYRTLIVEVGNVGTCGYIWHICSTRISFPWNPYQDSGFVLGYQNSESILRCQDSESKSHFKNPDLESFFSRIPILVEDQDLLEEESKSLYSDSSWILKSSSLDLNSDSLIQNFLDTLKLCCIVLEYLFPVFFRTCAVQRNVLRNAVSR